MTEVAEDRDGLDNPQDDFVKILDQTEFIRTIAKLLSSKRSNLELITSLLEFLMTLSEKSKHFSLKALHNDNLVDKVLLLIGSHSQSPQNTYLSSELLSNLLQACGSPDMRSKFVLTLQGIERLVNAISAQPLRADEDLEHVQNLIDVVGVCILDG